jgi:2-octaprenyl-6-methoxyphenol hydroxylase
VIGTSGMSGRTSHSDVVNSDVVICGSSYAGMLAALALAHQLGPELRITLVDRSSGPSAATGADCRATALSAASVNCLGALGLWLGLKPDAQPVRAIELTDTPLKSAVRPVVMTYENITSDGATASWILPNPALGAALSAALSACPSIRLERGTEVLGAQATDAVNTLELSDGRHLSAALIIAADGRMSRLREGAGIKTVGHDHPQIGIVTTIRHSEPHGGRAIQHFLPGGPFAVLPLVGGHTSCVTWSEDAENARTILALSDDAFLAEIDVRMAGARGTLALVAGAPRQSWPLESRMARAFVAPRLALVGDAAHSVHPIAGQGLNLAIRDVAALVECIADAAKTGGDIGTTVVLDRYERWRRFDSSMSTVAFDGLNRLFSNDNALLRSVRSTGLAVVNSIAPAKRLLVKEAAGLSGTLPKLLETAPQN